MKVWQLKQMENYGIGEVTRMPLIKLWIRLFKHLDVKDIFMLSKMTIHYGLMVAIKMEYWEMERIQEKTILCKL